MKVIFPDHKYDRTMRRAGYRRTSDGYVKQESRDQTFPRYHAHITRRGPNVELDIHYDMLTERGVVGYGLYSSLTAEIDLIIGAISQVLHEETA